MSDFTDVAARNAIEQEMTWAERRLPVSVYAALTEIAERHPDRPAVTFQLMSDPDSPAETLTWTELQRQVTQMANLLRSLGVGRGTVVAVMLPNCTEMIASLLGGMTAGIVNPINPLLDVEQIAGILNSTGARVLITLRAFPRSDIAQKAAEAVAFAPTVTTVLEVDLKRYLKPPRSWAAGLLRPRLTLRHHARTLGLSQEIARHAPDALDFGDDSEDRVAAYFHTGGTTGLPKVVQHTFHGMHYNGWLGKRLLFDARDVLICPLPLFHVFAAYPALMSAIHSGAHVVFPTPAGYRGEGVFDNFWRLIERWRVSFVITVPTALAALMQRPIDADLSSLRMAISGSAPLPIELYKRFEAATGVQIAEGYGLTEVTCLVSCNPMDGKKKVGSVGILMPYTDVRIRQCGADGSVERECAVDEIGEICVRNPGTRCGSTYTMAEKNEGLCTPDGYLRTGDLGRIDRDSYLWITGRTKDIIIRGGHNIDPAEIEQALMGHEDVAFVGAIGQPDARLGELPCAYVELVQGGRASPEELVEYARHRIHERAAVPKHLEILEELPKTAVGKVFKPDLRKRAITRIYDAALTNAGHAVSVARVVEDPKLGLVAELRAHGDVDEAGLAACLGHFTYPWRWPAPEGGSPEAGG